MRHKVERRAACPLIEVSVMNQKARISGGPEREAKAPDWEEPFAPPAALAQANRAAWPETEAMQNLEKTRASLALAYLNSNLNMKCVPLKAFLDECEKKILLASLRLTQGNQKNAALLLGIKPTALFEKLRKHGIRCQRGVYPGQVCGPVLVDGDN
jgi:DNA-binding NtrC family response regulator